MPASVIARAATPASLVARAAPPAGWGTAVTHVPPQRLPDPRLCHMGLLEHCVLSLASAEILCCHGKAPGKPADMK